MLRTKGTERKCGGGSVEENGDRQELWRTVELGSVEDKRDRKEAWRRKGGGQSGWRGGSVEEVAWVFCPRKRETLCWQC